MSETRREIRVDDDDDQRVLTRAWRGQRAVTGLERLCAVGGPRRVIDAQTLERADAFTAAVVRESIDRHLDRDPGHSVVLHEPRNPETRAMLHELVGPLPRRGRWGGDAEHPVPQRHALLPAMRVSSTATVHSVSAWLESLVSGLLGVAPSTGRLLSLATATFGDNALKHGPEGERHALLCACHEPQGNDLQIVALSPWVPEAAQTDGAVYMRDILTRSTHQLGGLFSVAELARRRDILSTLRVAAGCGRLYWRDGKPRFETAAAQVPAFAVSLEIHVQS